MSLNSSTEANTTNQYYEHVKGLPILIPVVFAGLLCTAFNIFTISIIVASQRLRKPSSYPLVSVLFGATLQCLLTGPLYVYRGMEESAQHEESWICDLYRLPYFLCGHVMKASFLVLSFDRLVATKYPYQYIDLVTKQKMFITMIFVWTLVLTVDLIPFLPFGKEPNDEGCTYVPFKVWGISVITCFDILPFAVTIGCYMYIWKVAAGMLLRDMSIRESVRSNHGSNNDSNHGQSTYLLKAESSLSSDKIDSPTTIESPTSEMSQINSDNSSSQFGVPLHEYNKYTENGKKTSRNEVPRSRVSAQSMKARAGKVIRFAWELKATRTSFVILLVYLVCWGPLGALYAIDHYCSNCLSESNEAQIALARFVVKIISLSSSFFLPLAYCWRTRLFRKESKRLVFHICNCFK